MKWAEAQVDSFTKPIQWESLNLNETYFCAPIIDNIHDERTGTLRIAAHQITLPATQQPPAAPPPADSEDRQLATIARGIAERIKIYELPLSNEVHFSFSSGDKTYAGDLYPHPTPLMEALRQLALWKAGQQVAEAAESAPVDALAKARERIAELEAEVARLQGLLDKAVDAWCQESIKVDEAGKQAINNRVAMHNEMLVLKETNKRLQEERDSAVRDANKRAFLLREIEQWADPKNRADGEVLAHTLNTIHAKIVRAALSTSAPESEATDA